jgi:hypothetical protein
MDILQNTFGALPDATAMLRAQRSDDTREQTAAQGVPKLMSAAAKCLS